MRGLYLANGALTLPVFPAYVTDLAVFTAFGALWMLAVPALAVLTAVWFPARPSTAAGRHAGSFLDNRRVETAEGKLIARKTEAVDVFDKWRGKGRIPAGLPVDEYLKKARE